jgi:hypothetical protein
MGTFQQAQRPGVTTRNRDWSHAVENACPFESNGTPCVTAEGAVSRRRRHFLKQVFVPHQAAAGFNELALITLRPWISINADSGFAVRNSFGQSGLCTGDHNASGSLCFNSCDTGCFFECIRIKQKASVGKCLKQFRLTDASAPSDPGLFRSAIHGTEGLAVIFDVPAVNLHAAEDVQRCSIHSSADLRKDSQQNVETAKRRAGVCSPCRGPFRIRSNQFGRESVSCCDDFFSRQLELLHERTTMPLANAKDSIDVLLQGRMLEMRQARLIRGVTTPEDHAWRNTAQKHRIERAKGNHGIPWVRRIFRKELMVMNVGNSVIVARIRTIRKDLNRVTASDQFARHVNDAALASPQRLFNRRAAVERNTVVIDCNFHDARSCICARAALADKRKRSALPKSPLRE